jgi:hypothetical protein
MNHELPLLSQIHVASPCSADWEGMSGDERVRFCRDCRLHVYNLSAMRREEAEELVRSHEGRLCVRYYRRHDGTVLTRDCPVGIRALRQRLVRAVAAIAGLVVALVSAPLLAGVFQKHKPSGYRSPAQAFSTWIQSWEDTPVAGKVMFLGDICAPGPAPPASPVGSGGDTAAPPAE